MSDKWKKKDKNVQNCEVKEEVNSQEILEEDEKCDRGGESHAEEKVDESPAVEEERCCRCCCCDSDDDDDDDCECGCRGHYTKNTCRDMAMAVGKTIALSAIATATTMLVTAVLRRVIR